MMEKQEYTSVIVIVTLQDEISLYKGLVYVHETNQIDGIPFANRFVMVHTSFSLSERLSHCFSLSNLISFFRLIPCLVRFSLLPAYRYDV